MTVRPPEDSPGSLSAIGNDKALHMEGFFASCGPPPARNELRGESSTQAHPNHRTCPTETGARMPPRPGISLPGQGSPQPEYPGPRFRPGILSPPLQAYHEAATAGSPTSPSGIAARYPQTRLHFPTSAQDVPLHEERPTHYQGAPRRIRLFIAGRPRPILPEVFQRPGSKRERKRDRKIPALFTLQPSPSFLPGRMACPISNRRQPTTGTGARPEERFFRDGESTRGEGAVFTKNAPSPLVIPLLQGLSPTKKAGQSPAPAFTGKTKER